MSVFALGLNHTTAPLDLRGRFAFAPEQLTPALRGLREQLARAMPEAAILSTCNRTELYVASTPERVCELVQPPGQSEALAMSAGRAAEVLHRRCAIWCSRQVNRRQAQSRSAATAGRARPIAA